MSAPGAPRGRRAVRTMTSPLEAIVGAAPLTVGLATTVRATLQALDRTGADTVVVADGPSQVPLGIVTLRDLMKRVALPGGDLDQPVAAAMTSGLITLSPQASAHEAALAMARHGVGRVLVTDGDGRLVGMIRQADLYALQGVGAPEVSARIQAAGDLAGLRQAAGEIRRLAEALVLQGVGVETLAQVISTLNDLLTIRAIDVCADDFDLPGVPICWVAMGSEGRLEQTLATDQDNGIVFEAPPRDAARVREALAPFARAVNGMLDACGFPLCAGNVMAGNPAWCLTLGEWRRTFSGWIQEPEPEALLNATIFFDFRAIHGTVSLAERLRHWLLAEVRERPVFLRLMAENAVRAPPPLGLLFGFSCDRVPGHPRTIDLKSRGSRLFADAARILALARGVPHTSTAQRLREVAELGFFSDETLAALLDAFHFVHLLRLRAHAQAARTGGANRVAPHDLNDLDRHVLRVALAQARRLQECLVMEYRLGE
jgi:CBS domain-containing protein